MSLVLYHTSIQYLMLFHMKNTNNHLPNVIHDIIFMKHPLNTGRRSNGFQIKVNIHITQSLIHTWILKSCSTNNGT